MLPCWWHQPRMYPSFPYRQVDAADKLKLLTCHCHVCTRACLRRHSVNLLIIFFLHLQTAWSRIAMWVKWVPTDFSRPTVARFAILVCVQGKILNASTHVRQVVEKIIHLAACLRFIPETICIVILHVHRLTLHCLLIFVRHLYP